VVKKETAVFASVAAVAGFATGAAGLLMVMFTFAGAEFVPDASVTR
jgi:hypothetical protein